MNGIFNVLKPSGMTSFDVVAYLRGLLKTGKIGHAGTLDPIAAGVLPVCVGRATKAIEYLMDKDKVYRAEMTLGVMTDTQDNTGRVLAVKTVNCTDEEITGAILSFRGGYSQIPPMYSALKIGGKRLYEMARNGVKVDRAPRNVEIYSLEIIDIKRDEKVRILYDIHCSKGTYIRTLCSDIGDRLGCGGHMSFLLRKRAGIFQLSETTTLEEIRNSAAQGMPGCRMISTDRVFSHLEAVAIGRAAEKELLNGRSVVPEDKNPGPGLVRVYGEQGRFLALGEIKKTDGRYLLKSRKFF